jgi:hypothetical protein
MKWTEKNGKVVSRREHGYRAEIAPSVTEPGKHVVWVYRYYCKTAAVGIAGTKRNSIGECQQYVEDIIRKDIVA